MKRYFENLMYAYAIVLAYALITAGFVFVGVIFLMARFSAATIRTLAVTDHQHPLERTLRIALHGQLEAYNQVTVFAHHSLWRRM